MVRWCYSILRKVGTRERWVDGVVGGMLAS